MDNIISDINVAKLMQHLNILQATSIIVGVSPSEIHQDNDNDSIFQYAHDNSHEVTKKFNDVLDSLIHAVKFGALKATVAYKPPANYGYNGYPSYIYQDDLKGDWFKTQDIDLHKTYIQRANLKQWLLNHDVKPPLLFIDSETDNIDYLNKNHDRYTSKLALCIRAWQSSQHLPDDVAVGKWLQSYIKDHASEYGLSESQTMAETLASICNWNTSGGNKRTYPYVRENIPNDYSHIPSKDDIEKENRTFLPELKEFLEPRPNPVDSGDIPF